MAWNEEFALAGIPSGDDEVPQSVQELAAGAPIVPIWRNVSGGLTFKIGADRYVKWQSADTRTDLSNEVWRLLWAARYTRVPIVVDDGGDEHGRWLVTEALPGHNAVSARWRDEPETAVRAIANGLRALHDTLPVDDCPFTWTTAERLDMVRSEGRRDPAHRHPAHQGLDYAEAIRRLASPPPIDQLVVCHGDACAPNTLIDENGAWYGHVDLGALGLADRWADIAVATWSVEWNYGAGWDGLFLDAYDVEPDPVRTAYYRLLWDLSP